MWGEGDTGFAWFQAFTPLWLSTHNAAVLQANLHGAQHACSVWL